MAMPRRKPNPLDEVRADVNKQRKDITALKARLVDAESRLAKAETALGTIGKSGVDAGNFAPKRDSEREEAAPEQQPETE